MGMVELLAHTMFRTLRVSQLEFVLSVIYVSAFLNNIQFQRESQNSVI
jgi:hypothetical protein